jgi:hypothetical protein
MGLFFHKDVQPVKVRFRVDGWDDLPRTYTLDYAHGEIEFRANEDAYHEIVPGRHRFVLLADGNHVETFAKIEEGTVCIILLKDRNRGVWFSREDRAKSIWE